MCVTCFVSPHFPNRELCRTPSSALPSPPTPFASTSLGLRASRKQKRSKKEGERQMAFNGGLRSGMKMLASSATAVSQPASRGLHSTSVKRMGGHGHDEPYYLHAKHMYNLDRMKHQKLKVSLGVLTVFSIGVAVPIYAVIFQQKKTASA